MMPEKQLPQKDERLELLYNLHDVCETLINDSPCNAITLFCERLNRIGALSGGQISEVDGMVLITSLNRSLYDFFQFYMQISLTECCRRNRVQAGTMPTIEAVKEAGIRVLNDYYNTFSQSGEACNHMKKACMYIHKHLDEPLTLKTVGAAIHISGSYLSKIFPRLTGQSFCDYVRDARIALGQNLLAETDMTVDAIAERCGFNTPNYFTTVFKKYTGNTPLLYRKESK